MSKRDRIAIVLSLGWTLFAVSESTGKWGSIEDFIFYMVPVFAYWGYRYIRRGDE